jgi:hypothetical protein
MRILPGLVFRSMRTASAVAAAVLGGLTVGCDPIFSGNPLGGGGSGCMPQSPNYLTQVRQALCQRLEQCFPQEFATSYPNATSCENSIWSSPSLPCAETPDQCLTDLRSAPCPACLPPLTQSGTAIASSATAFIPQSCQVVWTNVSFGNLSVGDAGCFEPGTVVDAGAPDAAPLDATAIDAPTSG